VRGEITLVVGGATGASDTGDPSVWARDVAGMESDGIDRRTAIATVAQLRGVARRDVYDAVVRARASPRETGK